MAQLGQERIVEWFETALLTGPPERLPAFGVARPTPEFGQRQMDFERDTARRLQQVGHSRDLAHRLVLAQEAQDIVAPLNEAAGALGVDPQLVLSSRDSLTDFMLSLPAKGAICRLRMTAHENPDVRWQVGDLHDMTALGTAAAYCDVVVAEKNWGSVLRRHAPRCVPR